MDQERLLVAMLQTLVIVLGILVNYRQLDSFRRDLKSEFARLGRKLDNINAEIEK